MALEVYRISHYYQIGDQDVFVESETDPTEAAVFCQFTVETADHDDRCVSNLGIAAALVNFYGCSHCAASDDAIKIDMYSERERLCGKWYRNEFDKSYFQREGLYEYLMPHVDE